MKRSGVACSSYQYEFEVNTSYAEVFLRFSSSGLGEGNLFKCSFISFIDKKFADQYVQCSEVFV